ncbi:MAG: hypothetical protein ABIJ97_11070 [Bacteroidota bacterium]
MPDHIIYENDLSSDGTWIVEPGAYLSYQKYIRLTHTSLQLTNGYYSDAAAQFAGFTGLYLKRKLFHKYKHSVSLAVGGAWTFRKSWNDFPGYVNESGFNQHKKFETKWMFTSELIYYHYLSNRTDLNVGFLYGHQDKTFTFVVGVRYWINPNVNIRDCDECGEKKFNRGKLKRWIKLHIKI